MNPGRTARKDGCGMKLTNEGLRDIQAWKDRQTKLPAYDREKMIRATLAGLYDAEVADAIRILYGGSVKPDTIDGLMEKPDVDGALVGGASLKAQDFSRIVKFGQKKPEKAKVEKTEKKETSRTD